jgi:hypothetical protein
MQSEGQWWWLEIQIHHLGALLFFGVLALSIVVVEGGCSLQNCGLGKRQRGWAGLPRRRLGVGVGVGVSWENVNNNGCCKVIYMVAAKILADDLDL